MDSNCLKGSISKNRISKKNRLDGILRGIFFK